MTPPVSKERWLFMKQQTTTIDTTTVTRITGPLAQPINNPFSMIVDVVREKEYERVTAPGVLLQNAEFASGCYWGRSLYFNDVDTLVDQAGRMVEHVTESQLPFVRVVKVRDITDQQVMDMIMDIMSPETPRELQLLDGQPVPPAFRAGLIFGYVHACVETAQAHEDGFPYDVASETAHHRIEVRDGCLSIAERRSPDHCVSLSPEETDQALEVLQIAQTGFTPVSNQEAAA
jgi:hypothetical protein